MKASVIDEVGAEEVILVSRDPAVACTEGHCRYRLLAGEPVDNVNIVNMLFNNVIT